MAARSAYQRGTVVLNGSRTRKLIRAERRSLQVRSRRGADAVLSIAGVPLTLQDEKQHCKFVGITGSGKTTAISHLIGAALARGDRAIIADPDGAYSARFFDATRGDIIFSPFSERSPRWDVFGEIHDGYDIEDLARSLIPDSPDSHDNEWREYARTFFTDVTETLWEGGRTGPAKPNVQDLHHLLTRAPVKELRRLLGNTPSSAFLDENAEKMFASIRAVTSSAVRAFKYIAQQDAAALSLRAWVKDDKAERGGVLFMPYHAGEIEALRSTLSAWMRLGIFEALNREEGDQRLWFVVDELGALGRIGGLTDGLTRLRKFGGRVVLGFQSIDQVEALYGRNDANAIVENCGNTLLLRCGTSDEGGTSAFASKLIGEREIMRTTQSRSYRSLTDFIGTRTRSEQFLTEQAVMAAEVEQLPNHVGYLRVSSRPEWMQVAVPRLESHRPASRRPLLERLGHLFLPIFGGGAAAKSAVAASPAPGPSMPELQSSATDEVNSIEHAPAETRANGQTGERGTVIDRITVPGYLHEAPYQEMQPGVYVDAHTRAEVFRDEGARLTTAGEDPQVIGSLIQIAVAREWKSILVRGSEEFRRAAWQHATRRGLGVSGYVPTQEDRTMVEGEMGRHSSPVGHAPRPTPPRPTSRPSRDTEAPARDTRRFTVQEKRQLLLEAEGMRTDPQRYRAFLQRWGLDASRLSRWQRALDARASNSDTSDPGLDPGEVSVVRAQARTQYRNQRDALVSQSTQAHATRADGAAAQSRSSSL